MTWLVKPITTIDHRIENPDARWFSITCLCFSHDNQPLMTLPIAIIFHPKDVDTFINTWIASSMPNMFDVSRYEIVIDDAHV
jgi:hypothetical protein